MQFLYGFLWSAAVSVPAYMKRSLTLNGAVSAILIGTLLYGFGAFTIYMSLVAFFLSSSVISKISEHLQKGRLIRKVEGEKGDCRDYTQVVCNGGVALAMALLYAFSGHYAYKVLAVLSFAVSASDTWASEVGALSYQKPVYLIKRTPVPTGLSGGVTRLGHASAFAGALFIACAFVVFEGLSVGLPPLWSVAFIAVGGFVGALVDSVLGEWVQAEYVDADNSVTEKRFTGNRPNKKIKGWTFMTNNKVNLLSNVVVVFAGALLLWLL